MSRKEVPQLPEKLYWLVALPGTSAVFDDACKQVKDCCITDNGKSDGRPGIFQLDCPADLAFKSFDSLVKLLDDLAKFDSQVESVLRRVEKMLYDFPFPPDIEVDGKKIKWNHPDFSIISSHKRTDGSMETFAIKQYMEKDFKWDSAKYLKTNTIAETTSYIMSALQKLDDAVRTKMGALSEQKSAYAAIAKKDGSLAVRDLIDVITPDLVTERDWFETEHLTTVAVIVPRGADKEFLSGYFGYAETVVPDCAKKLMDKEEKDPVTDKEGNSLYRVVLFKKDLEDFKRRARESTSKFVVREFSFSVQKYKDFDEKRAKMKADLDKQDSLCQSVCRAVFSDTFVSWMHLKVMRVFVDGVLRFGLEKGKPKFTAFMLAPKPTAAASKKIQEELTGLSGSAGAGAGKDDDEEYLPYVQLAMSPLATSD
jgi:V-type H+-transporting ATPase subunit C